MRSGEGGAPRRKMGRRRLLQVIGVGAATGLYAWQVEPAWLDLVERPLPIQNLPDELVGARLAHLSDIHVGRQVSDAYLWAAFDRVAALQPDIVVVTGDFISHHDNILAHARRLYTRLPRGRLATLGILGNHDYGQGWRDQALADSLGALLGELGVRILRNEIAVIDRLQIIGLDDLWADAFDPIRGLRTLDPKRAMLALSHNPDTVDLPGWARFSGWILAGHTHGGQIRPPFLPPPIVPVQNRRYTFGAFALLGNRHLYISRGLGHVMPLRLNVRPEVTMFTLTR